MYRVSQRLALLGATTIATAATAFAVLGGPSAAAAATDYTASAQADLVHVNAVNTPTINIADAFVAPVSSAVDSAGDPRSTATATNASVNLLGTGPTSLVVEATQSAPEDNPDPAHEELLTVPGAPLLTATVTSADASARWAGDGQCFLTGPMASSKSTVADAVVLPAAPTGGDLVSLNNTADPTGAAVSATSLSLVKNGATYAVQSTSLTEVTSVNIAGGAILVEVIAAPKVVATATGLPGGATTEITQPVLKVNGTVLVSGDTIRPLNIPGAPVIELTAGNVAEEVAANGTSALGFGNLLSLRVLDVTGTLTLATLTVGDVVARATAPVGGVVCGGPAAPPGGPAASPDPLREARKDSSVLTVNAGHTFDYTITVPNRGNADITDVTVTDTVTGTPALELVRAVPAPASRNGNVYTFNLGTIKPNQIKTVELTFKVPSSASVGTAYRNSAVIAGTYDGTPITKTVAFDGPTVDAVGTGACDLRRSTMFASNLEVTPGETFTYYVNVFNVGSEPCTQVVVNDTLIDTVTFVACTHSCTHQGQKITWPVGTVGPGASTQVAVTVVTDADALPGARLPGEAQITSAEGSTARPSTAGPLVSGRSVPAPGNPAVRGGKALPATGGAPLVAVVAALLAGCAAVLRRRSIA